MSVQLRIADTAHSSCPRRGNVLPVRGDLRSREQRYVSAVLHLEIQMRRAGLCAAGLIGIEEHLLAAGVEVISAQHTLERRPADVVVHRMELPWVADSVPGAREDVDIVVAEPVVDKAGILRAAES